MDYSYYIIRSVSKFDKGRRSDNVLSALILREVFEPFYFILPMANKDRMQVFANLQFSLLICGVDMLLMLNVMKL